MIGKACLAWLLLGCRLATAQLPQNATAAPAKPLAFEVVSIRPNIAGGEGSLGATPDGFRMVNMSLSRVILTAYVPQTGGALFWEPVGFPPWLSKDHYDITAKVAEADLPEWQKPASQTAMLRSMLQAMLADRCHLAVHRELKDEPVYYLVLGKNGPKFKESKPGPDPSGRQSPYPGGGLVETDGQFRRFSQAPITLLASFLTNMNLGGRPVQDRTGLTGLYDFVIPWGWSGGLGAGGEASDSALSLSSVVEALGLKLEPAQGKVETLVLDHVDRPSEN